MRRISLPRHLTCRKTARIQRRAFKPVFAVTGLIADLEKENRPKLLLFENVKNLLSVNRGFDFAKLLVELDEIGYDAEWAVINTADILPQNRERVFIIGHLRGGRSRQVFPVAESGKKNYDLQRFNTGTITARTGQATAVGTYVAESKFVAQKITYQQSNRQGVAVGSICTQASAKYQPGIMLDRSRTLKANSHDAGVVIFNGAECFIRKFTPLECWRLQGWEDEDFFRAFFLEKILLINLILLISGTGAIPYGLCNGRLNIKKRLTASCISKLVTELLHW